MAMGGFQRNRGYNQENAMSGMGALSKLLGQQSDSFQKIGDTVEAQGQASARGKVANLMGTDEYKDSNPEEAQALIQALTGGRQLGDRGTEMLKQTYGAKGEVQDNTWKENAATTLFGRQQAMEKQRAENALGLEGQKQKNRVGLATSKGEILGNLETRPMEDLKQEYDMVTTMLNSDTASQADKQEAAILKTQLEEQMSKQIGNTKMPSDMKTGAAKRLMPDSVVGKEAKLTKLPKAFSGFARNTSHGENNLLTKAYNADMIKPLPIEYYQANDPEVKSGKKEKGDKKYSEDAMVFHNGQWLRKNRAQIVSYLNKL